MTQTSHHGFIDFLSGLPGKTAWEGLLYIYIYIYSPFFSGRNTHILGNDSYSVYEEGDLREIVSGGEGAR